MGRAAARLPTRALTGLEEEPTSRFDGVRSSKARPCDTSVTVKKPYHVAPAGQPNVNPGRNHAGAVSTSDGPLQGRDAQARPSNADHHAPAHHVLDRRSAVPRPIARGRRRATGPVTSHPFDSPHRSAIGLWRVGAHGEPCQREPNGGEGTGGRGPSQRDRRPSGSKPGHHSTPTGERRPLTASETGPNLRIS